MEAAVVAVAVLDAVAEDGVGSVGAVVVVGSAAAGIAVAVGDDDGDGGAGAAGGDAGAPPSTY